MKHCVITGAADGIGKALAVRFGFAGYAVTGIDRDEDRSAQTRLELINAGIAATFVSADLAKAKDNERVVAHLLGMPSVDVLIHNAGINAVGRFGELDLMQQHAVLDVNLLAPLMLTMALLQHGHIAANGSIVFMSSLSHFVGYPGAATYAASKDGVASYARSLSLARPELHILTVFPGPTRTAHARRYSPDNRREHRRMPPQRLAMLILQAVRKRRRTLIPGTTNKLFALVGHVAPWLTNWLMRKMLFEKLP